MRRGDKRMKLFKPRFNQRQDTPDSALKPNPVRHYPACNCLQPQGEEQENEGERHWRELSFHTEKQDTNSEAWNALQHYIQNAVAEGADELNPLNSIGWENWEQIRTLPRTIGKLHSVRFLSLYGSHLVRIPPEIGDMANLEEFDPYTSYCLHWFPYEITRCQKLKRSRVSTRALYGNFKHRPPFPRLPSLSSELTPTCCSICRGPFTSVGPLQAWISLLVATDVLPLLVHACSTECLRMLPKPAQGYVETAHQGGLGIKQPPPLW